MPVGGLSISVSFLMYLLGSLFLLFSSDPHPIPKYEVLKQLRNQEPYSHEIEPSQFLYRNSKRKIDTYIPIAYLIFSTLLYSVLGRLEGVSLGLLIFLMWSGMIVVIVVIARNEEKRLLKSSFLEYISDILKIDIFHENPKIFENFIDRILFSSISNNKIINMSLELGIKNSDISKILLARDEFYKFLKSDQL
jgi:hypothetical protein